MLMRINKILYCLAVVVCILSFSKAVTAGVATSGENRAKVTGSVTDESGKSLSYATVSVPSLNKVARTNAQGRFELLDLFPRPVVIEVSHVGYTSATRQIDLSGETDAEIVIVLKSRVIEVGQITVTGSPVAVDPLNSPQDIQAVSGQTLQAGETAALGKVLEHLPGISSISTGSQAGIPVIRGLSCNRIRIMKDGVPLEYNQFSFRHQPVLNLAQAARVEVVQGAASVLYGSDALGGAANVITKPLPSSPPGKPYLSGLLKGQYFSNNQERAGGIEVEGAIGGFGYRTGFTGRRADNFNTPEAPIYTETGNQSDPKFTGELPFTNFDQYSGYVLVGISGYYGNIQAIYDRYDSEQNYLLADGKAVGQNLENDDVKLKGIIYLGPNVNLKPTLSFQRSLRQATEGVSYEENPVWAVDLVRTVYTARLDLVHSQASGLSGTIGLDLNVQDQETRASGLLPNANVYDFGVYAFEEYTRGRFTANAGLRFDYRKHKAQANSAMLLPDTAAGETDDVLTQDYRVFSGSVGNSYRLTDYLTVASNLILGFRAPDLFELHANGVHGGVMAFQIGNPYLDPERSYGIDVSLRLKTSRAVAKATVYHSRIDNYIYLRNQNRDTTIGTTTLPILAADQTDGTITGFELSSEVDVLKWLRLYASYSTITSDNRATGEELPLMPADRITAGVRLSPKSQGTFGRPYAEFRIKHAMAKQSAGTYEPFSQFDVMPFGTASTDAYTVCSFGAGVTLEFAGQPLSMYLEIENLLDETYIDFLDTYKGYALASGRSVNLRMEVPIQLL